MNLPPPFAARPAHLAPARHLPGAFMAQKAVSQPEPWRAVLWFIDCSFHSPLAHDPIPELSTVPFILLSLREEPCHAGKSEASSFHLTSPLTFSLEVAFGLGAWQLEEEGKKQAKPAPSSTPHLLCLHGHRWLSWTCSLCFSIAFAPLPSLSLSLSLPF